MRRARGLPSCLISVKRGHAGRPSEALQLLARISALARFASSLSIRALHVAIPTFMHEKEEGRLICRIDYRAVALTSAGK